MILPLADCKNKNNKEIVGALENRYYYNSELLVNSSGPSVVQSAGRLVGRLHATKACVNQHTCQRSVSLSAVFCVS